MTTNWRKNYQDFTRAVHARLEMGEKRYGHRGFEYSSGRLLQDTREEVWDAVAYLFMLHQRLNRLENKTLALDEPPPITGKQLRLWIDNEREE